MWFSIESLDIHLMKWEVKCFRNKFYHKVFFTKIFWAFLPLLVIPVAFC